MEGKKFEKPLGGRTVPNDPEFEDKEGLRTYVNQANDRRCKEAYPEIANIIEGWIAKIDVPAVATIFNEYLSRSGVPAERLNIPKSLYLMDGKKRSMAYDPVENAILINAPYFERELADLDDDDEVEARFVTSLFHEMSHAMSINRITGAPHSEELSGWHQNEPRDLFKLVNEGITEQIAQEVMMEYSRREFGRAKMEAVGLSVLNDGGYYELARQLVLILTGAIARETGVDEKIVWRSFVAQYYTGELRSGEIVELLNDTFGREFGERVAKCESVVQLNMLVAEFPAVMEHGKDTNERWLGFLARTRGAQ